MTPIQTGSVKKVPYDIQLYNINKNKIAGPPFSQCSIHSTHSKKKEPRPVVGAIKVFQTSPNQGLSDFPYFLFLSSNTTETWSPIKFFRSVEGHVVLGFIVYG
jgi:hypothetical protein